ncbi:MAG: PaaX family transcriptional regulator C-terminal domain-containing protein [Longimicrobiales bacterium]
MNQRPQDLVFTLFGEYLLHRPEPVWVGSLISLLETFGLSEGAVRTVLSRMARKGWLEGERQGRHAFYRLTAKGRDLLEEGENRIHHPPGEAGWDGRWYLLAYSIPEEQRHLRDRLRVRLAWLGFGSLGNGLWISPHDVDARVAALARDMDVAEHLDRFSARHLGPDDAAELVRRCWDLEGIDRRYAEFLERWRPRLDECRRRADDGTLDPEDAYRLRFELIHEFRAFPLEDPYLPPALLPPGWRGGAAGALVEALHTLCRRPADDYVDSILETHRP